MTLYAVSGIPMKTARRRRCKVGSTKWFVMIAHVPHLVVLSSHSTINTIVQWQTSLFSLISVDGAQSSTSDLQIDVGKGCGIRLVPRLCTTYSELCVLDLVHDRTDNIPDSSLTLPQALHRFCTPTTLHRSAR